MSIARVRAHFVPVASGLPHSREPLLGVPKILRGVGDVAALQTNKQENEEADFEVIPANKSPPVRRKIIKWVLTTRDLLSQTLYECALVKAWRDEEFW